ncbi:MAG TPA: hypothetical protein VJK51_04690 [Candidatus Nanoarchaeia archaeon]|nr:hypothetical protein [Candidatus Nanoarchaeia archaeon]
MGCYGVQCSSYSDRQFLTNEEKVEMLSEYKETLAKELQGVQERIKQLEKDR